MCNFIKLSRSRQRGIALLEALISMVIIAIACAGSLYIVSHANVSKTQMSMQNIAVQQMQQRLINHNGSKTTGACADWWIILPNVTDQNSRPKVTASGCADLTAGNGVSVEGKVIDKMPGRIILTATDVGGILGGNVVVGGSL